MALALGIALALLPAASAAEAQWLDVPFARQPRQGCGAAALAMVMAYWQRDDALPAALDDHAARLHRVLYSFEGGGAYASALSAHLEQAGFRTFAFRGEWADLRSHLERGRPLIVALGPERRRGPLHYVVVAGLDEQRGLVLLNDPAGTKLAAAHRAEFERRWSAAGRWTLLALPGSD